MLRVKEFNRKGRREFIENAKIKTLRYLSALCVFAFVLKINLNPFQSGQICVQFKFVNMIKKEAYLDGILKYLFELIL
jgi:hypothetical protein